jgi:exodeoxyribonuclease-3
MEFLALCQSLLWLFFFSSPYCIDYVETAWDKRNTLAEAPVESESGEKHSMNWKLATFNVNGIRARLPIIIEWLRVHQPDVLCLQEIKCLKEGFPLEPFLSAGYSAAVRGQKSFNGVAILSRTAPTQIVDAFGDGDPDLDARLIAALVDSVWVVNTYVPQGRDPDNPAFQYKLDFFKRLKKWLSLNFAPDQPIIWTGDLNVAPEPLDVFSPRRMEGKVGFHPDERQALADVVSWGFTDLFRKLHPDKKQFTFWDYRLPQAFARDLGWRIDHIMATRPMAEACTGCTVDMELRGLAVPSDHTAVVAEFEL